MKNRYLSESNKTTSEATLNAATIRNEDYYINTKKDLIIKLKYPTTEAKEIYDLDYLSMFQKRQKNDYTYSIRSTASSNVSNSSYSSASLNISLPISSSSSRNSVSKSDTASMQYNDESFTFQDFVSSILNNENKDYQILIIQDIARLMELKFRDFKKKLMNQKNLQQILNTSTLYLNSDSDLFTKIAEAIFKQACEEPNGILGARLKLNLFYDNNEKCINLSDSFAYDSTTIPTSEIIVNLKQDKSNTYGDSVGGFGLIKRCLKYLHSKYFQHTFTIDSSNFELYKNRLY